MLRRLADWRAPGPPEGLPPGSGDSIPRLLHVVFGLWDSGPLPWRYRKVLAGWRAHHPDWRFVLWNRSSAKNLVEQSYPQLTGIYHGFNRCVQRSDLLRYLILHRHGGVYADLDLDCLASLEPVLQANSLARIFVLVETVLSPERAEAIGRSHSIRNNRPELPERIANFFLAASAGHPLLARVLELVCERSTLPVRSDYDVLYTTGPDVVTEVIQGDRARPDLIVLDQNWGKRHLRHHHYGTWRCDQVSKRIGSSRAGWWWWAT